MPGARFSRSRQSASLLAPVLLLAAGAPSYAQTEASAGPIEVEEILVTATKRITNLQATPLAVTALSGRRLDELGARDFEDYFRRVPGLAVVDNGAGRKRYLLRGVSTINANGTQATVAQYLDEVPLTDNFDAQPDPRLIDIERIEVLRGPQGTLFGARAVSGTIRTITRKPVLNRIEGNATATFSETRFGGLNTNLEGVLNVPVAGSAALRVAAFYSHDEGYIDNAFPGGTFMAGPGQFPPGVPPPPPITLAPVDEPNFTDVTFYGARAALRWVPTDKFTLDLMWLAQKGKINGVPVYDVGITGDESDGLKAAIVGNTGNDDELYLTTATAAYDLTWADITAVASYAQRRNIVLNGAMAGGPLLGSGPGGTESSGGDTKGLTFEARVASKPDKPIQWLLGGYAFTQTRDFAQRRFLGFAQVLITDSAGHSYTTERAGFGEISYRPIAPLTLTAGLRYSAYYNRLNRFFIVPPPGGDIAAGEDPNVPTFSEDSTTLKFSVNYQVDRDVMIYALASQGFRPGGFNPGASPGFNAVPQNFKSDSLWNYEIGAKTQWADHRVTVNGALFRIDWSNMQVQGFTPAPAGPMLLVYTTNAATSQIYGLELEASAQVSESVSLDFSFNHFFKNELTKDGLPGDAGLTPRAGDPLSYNPRTSFLVGVEYRRPIAGRMSGSVRLDWSYTGRRFTGFHPLLDDNTPNNFYNNYSPYNIVGLRFGLNTPKWRASLFVDNIFDARPAMRQQNYAPIPVTTRVTTKPRTFGATLTRSF